MWQWHVAGLAAVGPWDTSKGGGRGFTLQRPGLGQGFGGGRAREEIFSPNHTQRCPSKRRKTSPQRPRARLLLALPHTSGLQYLGRGSGSMGVVVVDPGADGNCSPYPSKS